MKAKDLLKLIPNHVRITRKATYEVLWTDEFYKDGKQLGECDYYTKQIKINRNQSPTEAYATYIHELFHAMSFETPDMNLTEKQVQKLEQATMRVLKLNGVLEKL